MPITLAFGHLLLFPQSKASPNGLQEFSCARKGFAPALFMGPMACPAVCGYSSPWLGHLLLKSVSKPKLTLKTLASGSLSKSQASPFLIQDMTTEVKCPQNPVICACMLPLDCLPWFWMLALLSECVTCDECPRRKDIQILAVLTCRGVNQEESFLLSGKCWFLLFSPDKTKTALGLFLRNQSTVSTNVCTTAGEMDDFFSSYGR